MNESSVSKLAEREFRLVEPNKVATGAEFGVGDNHMPVNNPISTGMWLFYSSHTFCVIRPVGFGPEIQLNAFATRLGPVAP